MATAKRTTFASCRQMLAPASDPVFDVLTRSQRLRLADLAIASGVTQKRWIQRAVENFLQDEAPARFMMARQ